MNARGIKAVILLAGDGGRLQPLTHKTPKCLLVAGGKPLLWYSLTHLIDIGISEFIFVVGHKAEMIKHYVQQNFPNIRCTFIYNNEYNEKNIIYSFYLARKHLRNTTFLRVEGDLLYNRDIPLRLLSRTRGIISAVEPKHKTTPEEFCVRVNPKKGTIIEYGKHIAPKQAYGLAHGIDFVAKNASLAVFHALEEIIRRNQTQEYAEFAFQYVAKLGGPVFYQDNDPTDFWFDVDTEADLAFAQKNIQKIWTGSKI